jgi:hypothetical protein
MGGTSNRTGANAGTASEATEIQDADAPTRQLVSAAVSDRCASCGTQLANDQRYCLNCGQRRGKPRFSVAGAAPQAVETGQTRAAVRSARERPRLSSGSTLVAGIGVLLLAMGVGVLIGRINQNPPARNAAAPIQVVTVGGGGSSSNAPATGGVSTTASTAPASTRPRRRRWSRRSS